jgi:hypothetical protein
MFHADAQGRRFICSAICGVHQTSIVGMLLRVLILIMGSVVGAILLIVGLVLVGLNGMGH